MSLEEELKQERDNLKGQIDYLTKKLFGSSSEKGIGQIPGQRNLFNEAEASADPFLEEEDAKDATEALKKTRQMYPKRDPEKSVQLTRNVIKESP